MPIAAVTRQQRSRIETAGVLARAALAIAAERMGGQAPAPFVHGEAKLRAEILQQVRAKLGVAPEDDSDEALRAIEDALDAEIEAVAEQPDLEAAMARVAAAGILTGHTTDLIEREGLQAHEDSVWTVPVTLDGKLAAPGSRRTRKVWNLEANQLDAVLEGHKGSVEAVAVKVRVRDLQTLVQIAEVEGIAELVRYAITPDGHFLLASDVEGLIH